MAQSDDYITSQPTLISTKNSRDAVRHLLTVSQASYLIVDEYHHSYAQSLELPITIVLFGEIPQNKEQTVEDFPNAEMLSDEAREKEMDRPVLYLHTSGSTGHPKIISIVSAQIFSPPSLISLITGSLVSPSCRLLA